MIGRYLYGCGWVLKLVFNCIIEKIIGIVKFKVYELEEYKLSWVLFIGDIFVVFRLMGVFDWE